MDTKKKNFDIFALPQGNTLFSYWSDFIDNKIKQD